MRLQEEGRKATWGEGESKEERGIVSGLTDPPPPRPGWEVGGLREGDGYIASPPGLPF